jgi:hypothetical protein
VAQHFADPDKVEAAEHTTERDECTANAGPRCS